MSLLLGVEGGGIVDPRSCNLRSLPPEGLLSRVDKTNLSRRLPAPPRRRCDHRRDPVGNRLEVRLAPKRVEVTALENRRREEGRGVDRLGPAVDACELPQLYE